MERLYLPGVSPRYSFGYPSPDITAHENRSISLGISKKYSDGFSCLQAAELWRFARRLQGGRKSELAGEILLAELWLCIVAVCVVVILIIHCSVLHAALFKSYVVRQFIAAAAA